MAAFGEEQVRLMSQCYTGEVTQLPKEVLKCKTNEDSLVHTANRDATV